jgi:hypothetical protein
LALRGDIDISIRNRVDNEFGGRVSNVGGDLGLASVGMDPLREWDGRCSFAFGIHLRWRMGESTPLRASSG